MQRYHQPQTQIDQIVVRGIEPTFFYHVRSYQIEGKRIMSSLEANAGYILARMLGLKVGQEMKLVFQDHEIGVKIILLIISPTVLK